jgi:K+-transporting ATPase ATPase C chain
MQLILINLRLCAVTLAICVGGYGALILGIAQAITPASANGSLLEGPEGTVVGSRLLAQKFTEPRWFWPRPSAVDYNGAGAGGSNESPTSPDLAARAQAIVAAHAATPEKPLPADLAAASGGGLDPHVSERAALYQVERIAAARSLPQDDVQALVRRQAFAPGGFLTSDRLVNVLELNLALQALAAGQRR